MKCPAELIAGVLKLTGDFRRDGLIGPGLASWTAPRALMGQALMDPPSVEGWHTGKEWIDGGTLTERINFAVDQVKVTVARHPGVHAPPAASSRRAGLSAQRAARSQLARQTAGRATRCLDLIERLLQLAGYRS